MLLLAFLGGVFTILSPCILPVIPLAFAARGRAFARETAPMLVGLAMSFAATAAIGATAAHWLASAAAVGRVIAFIVVALMGVALLVPAMAQRLVHPVVRVGALLSTRAAPVGEGTARPSSTAHALLGVAIGMLWAPCAGPILALLIAATARESWNESVGALLAFALGGAVSLGAVLWLGERASARLAWVRTYEQTIRRATGALALASAVLIATGWDRNVFRLADFVTTAHAETVLLSRLTTTTGSRASGPESPEPDVGTFLAANARARSIRGLRAKSDRCPRSTAPPRGSTRRRSPPTPCAARSC
jgi:cytochrome c biogenesis protein CcdA